MSWGVREALVAALLGSITFLVFHPPVLGIGSDQLMAPGWDLTRVFWADLAFLRRAVAEASLPLWNPFDRGGYPFAAEPQSAVYDPSTWLLVVLALILGSTPAHLMTLKVVACFGVAASGMNAYLKERGIPPWARVLGTVVFIAGARMDKLKDQSALWPSAWAMWFLFALHRWSASPTRTRGAMLGAAGGMMLVSGYPPVAFRLALLALPLGVASCVGRLRVADDARALARRMLSSLGVAVLVGAAISAAQIVATLQVLPGTTRAGMGAGQVLASRVHPEHALGFLAPHDVTAAMLIYAGAAAAALCVVALVVRHRDPTVWIFAVASVLGFLMATGEHGWLGPLLADLPGFRSFRITSHYLLLTSVGVAVLIAEGAHGLRSPERGLWPVPLLALAAVVWASVGPVRPVAAWVVGGAGFVATVAVWRWPHRPLAAWGLCTVVALELFVVGREVAVAYLQPVPTQWPAESLSPHVPDPAATRVADFRTKARRPGPHGGLRDLAGHRPALTDPRYLKVYKAARQSIRVLRAMNVSVAAFPGATRLARHRGVERLGDNVYSVPDPFPRAFFVESVQVEQDDAAMLQRLRWSREPRAMVLAEDLGDSAAWNALRTDWRARATAHVTAAVTELGMNSVRVDVTAPNAGVLVLADAYAPGWTARVDGELTPIRRVNLVQRGVSVGAGKHVVSFEFEPRWARPLWAISLLTWFGLFGLVIRGQVRRRRSL